MHCPTMAKLLVVLLGVFLCSTTYGSASISPEDKYINREVMHQMANWLVQVARNNEAVLCNPLPQKRNSEIINSILGLPKNLNDAGRK